MCYPYIVARLGKLVPGGVLCYPPGDTYGEVIMEEGQIHLRVALVNVVLKGHLQAGLDQQGQFLVRVLQVLHHQILA